MLERNDRIRNHRQRPDVVSENRRQHSMPQGRGYAVAESGGRNVAQRGTRRRRHRSRAARKLCVFVAELVICLGIIGMVRSLGKQPGQAGDTDLEPGMSVGTETFFGMGAGQYSGMDSKGYPEELAKLLELNEEAADYVEGYPERAKYQNQPIDLTQDFQNGEVPLLMQWDRRWGYDAYGNGMIGLSGCGPVCLNMVYLYFTGDIDMTPREMAAFAYEQGYYAEGGTNWSLWTEGAAQLGLFGEELPLDENRMKCALDAGGLVVCSMRPGDFTTTGHFILLRGYDENGFYVNDPNRRSNSERQWDYDTLQYQIKNLWVLQK